ncbi:MAG: carboxylesterase family protein [Armatimonas sp.]
MPLPRSFEVEGGQLSGVPASPGSPIRAFKGIPYAAPPVGPLRWKPPQPVIPWSGVRKAEKPGPSAMQADTGAFGPWTKEFIFSNEVSEDCLYLNIWTGATNPRERRPVLVFIHGGGFTGGSGEVVVYDGEALAKKGLVVVTINYRLGVFGFLVHPELTKESEHGSSGNYALLDQLAALKWVQRNIAVFGGDPKRVTIAGQSAGASSVHYLLASPQAKGVFHRAIAESGSRYGRPVPPRAPAEKDGLTWMKAKGADSLATLRAMPAAALLGGNGPYFNPVADGWFLPTEGALGFASDVPVLTGFNADEGSSSTTYGKLGAAGWSAQARQRYEGKADGLLALYPATTDSQASESQKASERDLSVVSMSLWAQSRARSSRSRSFLYYFAHPIPWPQHPEFAAFHTSEVPYVFNNLRFLDRPWEPADHKLADVMSSYWANFAAKGDPNGKGLPRWNAYSDSSPNIQRLDTAITVLPLPEKPKWDFFTGLLQRR